MKPGNWSTDYALVYGGMYGEEEQVSDADIIGAIKEIEAGATATETARKVGVSINTMRRRRAKFGGMTVSEAEDRRRLEDENRRLRQLVAQFALENDAMKVSEGRRHLVVAASVSVTENDWDIFESPFEFRSQARGQSP